MEFDQKFDEGDAPLSRRKFIAGITTALGGAGLLAAGGERAQAAKAPYGPFRMSIQSYSLRHFPLEEALKITQSLGLKYWEAYPGHFDVTDSATEQNRIKGLLKAHDITLKTFGVVYYGNNEKDWRKAFEFAKAMGIETLSSSPAPESFALLNKLVDEYKINIAIHNHGPGDRYAKIATEAEALKGQNVRIGSCIDTGHFLRSSEDPVLAAQTFGKRVYGVHLKDVKTEANGDKHFTEVGKGDLNAPLLLQTLRKNGFKGLLSIEYEEHEDNPTPFIEECLAATRAAVKKGV